MGASSCPRCGGGRVRVRNVLVHLLTGLILCTEPIRDRVEKK